METLINSFDALQSENDDLREQANEFLIDQIDNTEKFYDDLFNIYLSSSNALHKKLSVILIKCIIKSNFEAVQQNFQDFSNFILNAIENSSDTCILMLLADIVFQIALKLFDTSPNDIWEDYINYLVLYRVQNDAFPFCIYLYLSSMCDQNFFLKYEGTLNEIKPEIILIGLQHSDIEIKLYSTRIFAKTAKNLVEEAFLPIYQEHYNIICHIARESLELNENDFILFWTYLLKIDKKISNPLFDIAYTFLSNEGLSPGSRNVLFQHIVNNEELLDPEDVEAIIIGYFKLQCELDEVDNTSSIFLHFLKIDEEGTYILFKTYIIEFLKSEDLKMEYVGLNMLQGLFFAYPKQSVLDISEILRISFEAASHCEDNVLKGLEFLQNYLHGDQLNLEDSTLAIDFLVNVIVECTNTNIQYRALRVCQDLTTNSVYFDKLIEIYEKIQPESLAVYFSILLYFYTADSNINIDKYEPFLKFLIEIFTDSYQKVEELLGESEDFLSDSDNVMILYNYVLLRGSAANLILFLSFFSPIQLGELVEPAIESFINLLKLEDLNKIDQSDFYGLRNVKDDFTNIFYVIKEPAIDLIRRYYAEISDGEDLETLQHLLCSYDGLECNSASFFIQEFEEEYENLKQRRNFKEISGTFLTVINPISHWIYKVPDDENNHQIHKKFLTYVNFLLQISSISYDIFNHSTEILLRIVKPKRTEYNRENDWYKRVCDSANMIAMKAIRDVLPKFDKFILARCFPGLANLLLLFVYSGNNAGHTFLKKYVIPFYAENQESSEVQILDLFSRIANLGYCNDEEIDGMLSIVNDIIERGRIYHDPQAALFNLITDLSKIRPEISASYAELALSVFKDIKDDPMQSLMKFHIARFLLSSFNANPQEFQELYPFIPDILSVFPTSEKHRTEEFWLEMKAFIEICKDSITKEIFDAIVESLARYLSYQNFTSAIFVVSKDENDEIIRLFGELVVTYCTEVPDMSLKDILDNILPHQPSSIDFILSLYSDE